MKKLSSSDLAQIQNNALKRFADTLPDDDGLAATVGKAAAIVATLVIDEYHKKLQEEE
ncbi:hypothetical protein J6TS7_58720 [Paenibacillus dendritiformis]|uniref:hypothetical protein n=1 Tax=Paenibacillus dendritiformis TaxID=130049 RepID=UPI001B11793F|nr:hypothetical protein [Paenibacillus dendritiformis]GIO82262.1 hypothetical protein J6TS7_58720 [Paenibacillus dendritiformis]